MARWGMLAVAGCAGGGTTTPPTDGTADTGLTLVELVNVGEACLFGDGLPTEITTGTTSAADTTFTLDAPVSARVVFDDCASGCVTDVVASCTARIVSTELVVDATASYTLPAAQTCPSVCVPVIATCEGPVLTAAYWTLDYGGGHSDGFSVPGTAPVPCATGIPRSDP